MNKSHKISDSLISSIDIAPTILDLAGIEVGPSFQGKSFREVLHNPELEFRNFVFAEHNWHDHEAYERMVRTKDYLYVLNLRPNLSLNGPADSNKSDSYADLKRLRDLGKLNPAQADIFSVPRPFEQLFFVTDDYDQLVNIGAVPKYKEKLLEMRAVLDQWRKETLDTAPDDLTGDWYDKETGDPLKTAQTRGTMPGGPAAMKTTQKGPF
jgi:arylsulfatase A-like enzyme